jgi:hypothetical protein
VSNRKYGPFPGTEIVPRLNGGVRAASVVGRRARRFCCAVFVMLVLLSGGIRLRSYLLARKIHAVVSALGQIRVDATTEEELLKTIPSLVRVPRDTTWENHVYRGYEVRLSNLDDIWKVLGLQDYLRWVRPSHASPEPASGPADKWGSLNLPLRAAYVLGLRHLSFRATVTVLDGTVSSIFYALEPDVFRGWPAATFVEARSAHAFWQERRNPIPVYSTDDESPDFRFGYIAGERALAKLHISVAYTPQAPRQRVSHAFNLDLSCYWGLSGCESVRQVVPLLWNDRQEVLAATAARLTSPDPCPARILAGRVRTLLHLNVALLEVVGARHVDFNHEGDRSSDYEVDYRLNESLLGDANGSWTGIRRRPTIPWPPAPQGRTANPARFPMVGEKYLYFDGGKFDSCRVVPAAASAEAAIRASQPPPKRIEDAMTLGGRM